MSQTQVKLDFSRPILPVEEEKKTELVSFRIGEKFKRDLEAVARAKGRSVSDILFEYTINGYLEDYKSILLQQLNGNRTLRDLMK